MSEDSIGFDTVLDLCGDRHCRIALAVIANERRRLTVNDLGKAIAKHGHDVHVTEVSGEALSQVQTSLHHEHLPKLEAVGLVEYDPTRRLVEPTDRVEEARPHLSALVEADPLLESPLEL